MTTELHERLASLADDAPRQLAADGLWQRGRRRQRIRQGIVAGVAVLVALGGVGLVQGLPGEKPDTAPIVEKDGSGHLPKHVYLPGRWSKGTADEGPIGPLAVLDFAPAGEGAGDRGGVYGVSAADGTVRYLDIPSVRDGRYPGLGVEASALSPDGSKVGFVRFAGTPDVAGGSTPPAVGFGVYDTVSGKVTELSDPKAPEISSADAFEMAFTGDSRYLVTDYSRSSPATSRTDALVLWDVETGRRIQAEGPGRYWLPNVGSAPHAAIWSHDDKTWVLDPETGRSSTFRLPLDVVTASFSPNGSGFAYIGSHLSEDKASPWRLFVGPSRSRLREVRLPQDAGAILGWRDPTHVVVAYDHQKYAVVDVNTLATERGEITGEQNFYSTEFARDLWAGKLVAGVKPPAGHAPWDYQPWIRIGLLLVLGAGVGWLILRRGHRGRA